MSSVLAFKYTMASLPVALLIFLFSYDEIKDIKNLREQKEEIQELSTLTQNYIRRDVYENEHPNIIFIKNWSYQYLTNDTCMFRGRVDVKLLLYDKSEIHSGYIDQEPGKNIISLPIYCDDGKIFFCSTIDTRLMPY